MCLFVGEDVPVDYGSGETYPAPGTIIGPGHIDRDLGAVLGLVGDCYAGPNDPTDDRDDEIVNVTSTEDVIRYVTAHA